jgi:hypothetical protein
MHPITLLELHGYADYIDGIPESGARPMRARVSKYVDQE